MGSQIGVCNIFSGSETIRQYRETYPYSIFSVLTIHTEKENIMKTVFQFVERIAPYALRISLGLVLLWIGALHLQNPQSIVVLLSMSLPFLASSAFVYVLGALEVIALVLLIAGLWVRSVGLLTLALFAGTLTIFVIAPAVPALPVPRLIRHFLM